MITIVCVQFICFSEPPSGPYPYRLESWRGGGVWFWTFLEIIGDGKCQKWAFLINLNTFGSYSEESLLVAFCRPRIVPTSWRTWSSLVWRNRSLFEQEYSSDVGFQTAYKGVPTAVRPSPRPRKCNFLEPVGSSGPKMATDGKSAVITYQNRAGTAVAITCHAQSYPAPGFRWVNPPPPRIRGFFSGSNLGPGPPHSVIWGAKQIVLLIMYK